MIWYTAHIVMAILPENYDGGAVSFFENVYLVCGKDEREALGYAKALAEEEERAKSIFYIDDVPSHFEFLGIRKLISISNPEPPQDTAPPTAGTELTYSIFQADNLDDAKFYASDVGITLKSIE